MVPRHASGGGLQLFPGFAPPEKRHGVQRGSDRDDAATTPNCLTYLYPVYLVAYIRCKKAAVLPDWDTPMQSVSPKMRKPMHDRLPVHTYVTYVIHTRGPF